MLSAHDLPNLPRFMQRQFEFTAHLRDPEHRAAPLDVAADRMAVYRELVYNNVEDFLANAFPVIRRISKEAYWHSLVRDFFVNHRATTPYFHRMPDEFLRYLESEREPSREDYPFLHELAHYEWAELALSIDDSDIDENAVDPHGDLLHGIPILSPHVMHCCYRFPVHRISPDSIPEQAPETPTHLVVYRDRKDQVGFLELNPVTALLLSRLQENHDKHGEELLRDIAAERQHLNPDIVLAGGRQIMQDLHARDVILGTKNRSNTQ